MRVCRRCNVEVLSGNRCPKGHPASSTGFGVGFLFGVIIELLAIALVWTVFSLVMSESPWSLSFVLPLTPASILALVAVPAAFAIVSQRLSRGEGPRKQLAISGRGTALGSLLTLLAQAAWHIIRY